MILSAHTATRMMLLIESDDDAIMTALDAFALNERNDDSQIELCDFIEWLSPTDANIAAIDRELRNLR